MNAGTAPRAGPQEQPVGISQMFPWFGKLKLRGEAALEGANAMQQQYGAPMVGGMVSSPLLTLIILPVIYFLWPSRRVEASPTEAKPVPKQLIASIVIGALVP